MFDVFPVVRQLHELLWYLDRGARPCPPPARSTPICAGPWSETERLTAGTPEELAELDVPAHRQDVNVLLLRTSELVRAGGRRAQEGTAAAPT